MLSGIYGWEPAYPVLSDTETWVGPIIDFQISFVNAQLRTYAIMPALVIDHNSRAIKGFLISAKLTWAELRSVFPQMEIWSCLHVLILEVQGSCVTENIDLILSSTEDQFFDIVSLAVPPPFPHTVIYMVSISAGG